MSKKAEFLIAKIYNNYTSDKKYVTLGTYESNYTNILSLHKNVDVGNVFFKTINVAGEKLNGAKYYILNEQKEVIWDVNGFEINSLLLPVGKYYVQEYEAPKAYLLNSNEYEINIQEDGENLDIEIVHDKLF